MRNVEKWLNIFQKLVVYIARFLKHISPFFNIMHEKVKKGVTYNRKEKNEIKNNLC